MEAKLVYRSRIVGAIFIPFGLTMLFFAMCLPFLLESPLLGFILMGIPMIFTAVIMLLHGFAAASTRIEIAPSGLRLAIPGWRAFPVPPARKASLSWDEVLAVRKRTELYHVTILPFAIHMPYPVEVFAVDTTQGRFILGGRISWLHAAMKEIALRSGRAVRSEGEVQAGLFSSLLSGAPEWRRLSEERESYH